jgi:hypothetical protein
MADAVPPGLVEHGSRRLAAADDEEKVGVGRVERPDSEIGEHVADGTGQGPAAGVVVQGDPEPRPTDEEAAGVDDGPAGEQRPEDVSDVGLELGNLGPHEPAQLVDVTDSVEKAQERTKARMVVDDGARGGANLEVGGITAQEWRTGTDGRPQGHRLRVTGGRADDEPIVHTS